MKRPGPSSDSHSDSHACGPGRARTSCATAVVLPEPAGATTSRMRRPSAASASVPSHARALDRARADGGHEGLRGDESARTGHGRSAVGVRVRNSRPDGVNGPFPGRALQTPGPAPMDIA